MPLPTDHPPLARTSDPESSHRANDSIAKDMTLRDHILQAAGRLMSVQECFDDTDLTEAVEDATLRRQQRNVIARSRGLMERDGLFVRVGIVDRGDRRTVHFTTWKQLELF